MPCVPWVMENGYSFWRRWRVLPSMMRRRRSHWPRWRRMLPPLKRSMKHWNIWKPSWRIYGGRRRSWLSIKSWIRVVGRWSIPCTTRSYGRHVRHWMKLNIPVMMRLINSVNLIKRLGVCTSKSWLCRLTKRPRPTPSSVIRSISRVLRRIRPRPWPTRPS